MWTVGLIILLIFGSFDICRRTYSIVKFPSSIVVVGILCAHCFYAHGWSQWPFLTHIITYASYRNPAKMRSLWPLFRNWEPYNFYAFISLEITPFSVAFVVKFYADGHLCSLHMHISNLYNVPNILHLVVTFIDCLHVHVNHSWNNCVGNFKFYTCIHLYSMRTDIIMWTVSQVCFFSFCQIFVYISVYYGLAH